ncbi:MAG: hypothetical protein WCD89_23070, partial [Anaerocolumna sp.]
SYQEGIMNEFSEELSGIIEKQQNAGITEEQTEDSAENMEDSNRQIENPNKHSDNGIDGNCPTCTKDKV